MIGIFAMGQACDTARTNELDDTSMFQGYRDMNVQEPDLSKVRLSLL